MILRGKQLRCFRDTTQAQDCDSTWERNTDFARSVVVNLKSLLQASINSQSNEHGGSFFRATRSQETSNWLCFSRLEIRGQGTNDKSETNAALLIFSCVDSFLDNRAPEKRRQ